MKMFIKFLWLYTIVLLTWLPIILAFSISHYFLGLYVLILPLCIYSCHKYVDYLLKDYEI